MLPDADRSIANWLRGLLPDGTGIRFEAPDPQWTARPPEPRFVDVFLYDIRQDSRGNESGWSDVRDANGRVVGRRPAAQYYRLAYLATAWAGVGSVSERVATEHEILGLLLSGCAHQGVLPEDCLTGTLAQTGEQTILDCAPTRAADTPGPLWTGLGIAPRASIELVLVAPAQPPVLTDVAPPAREIVVNAEIPPVSKAVAAVADAQLADRAFGTLRRWEKKTIREPR